MRTVAAVASTLVVAAGLGTAATLSAQENDTCLVCHENAAMFAAREDGSRLVVNRRVYERSVHGATNVQCVACHQGMTFPHPEESAAVDCSGCHGRQASQHATSLHGQAAARGDPLAPSCVDCHGRHDVQRSTSPGSPTNVMNIPFLCGECHHEGSPVSRTRDIPQERILENYSLSMHGEGLFRQGLTVTAVCTSCHTAHRILPHTDRRSSIHKVNVARTCTRCHAQIERVHRQVIEGSLWRTDPDKIPACPDCHSPHKIRGVFYAAGSANSDCLACHGDSELTMEKNSQTISLYVDEQAYNATDHSGTACAQCHTEVTTSLSRPCETVVSNVDCSVCHAEQVGQYDLGIHGTLAAQGDPDAPVCLDCHSKHATQDKSQPASPTFPRNVPELCARCHRKGEAAAVRIGLDDPDIVQSYEMSTHGKGLLESGLVVTAMCTNCHTAHGEQAADDLASTVHSDNIPDTCGTCHHGIQEEFEKSIHATTEATDSDRQPPTCKDCHTSHTISRTDRADFRLLMMDQCGRCHTDESETFFETYHGKVSRLGDAGAAKCYDCHGTHNILPVDDLGSTLSRSSIVETCSQCHGGAHRRFAGYLTHATHHDPDKYPFLFWTFWAMTALLVGTLTFAMFHVLAWMWRLWRTPGEWKRPKPARGEKLYQRFTPFQRMLHMVMLLSFFTLAITGMVLKFSYTGWAQFTASIIGGFVTTGVLHRVGAITLLAIFAVHLWDVKRQKERSGKSWRQVVFGADSLVFNRNDLTEFIGSWKWFLGFGPRPRYGRYTYWEKFDYFAVFWGMIVIGISGLMLWFPELFTYVLPGRSINIATIIHSDEALLAVAFIFTVHFFNTHFRLDKFPMDPVIFTGRVALDELKHDKPKEYEKLVASGELEERLVDPYPENVERGFKIFGFFALGVGLTLIFLIILTMLFGYR